MPDDKYELYIVPGWMRKPKEARPQDMAIWRAVLAGEERVFSLWGGPALQRRVRKCLLRGEDPFFAGVVGAPEPPSKKGFRDYRFVLFTHPFTGGRAVFSEPVD